MHRCRTLSKNLFVIVQSSHISNCTEKAGSNLFFRPWLRSISSTCSKRSSSSGGYKNISDILNVTSNGGKGDSSSEIAAEHETIKEVQSLTHFSGPGGKTRTGVILGIETSADDTG